MSSGLVEVTVVHVKHPNTRSPIRRWIYLILERNAVQTDLGWVVHDERTLKRVLHLAERARDVEGVEDAVKVYRIMVPQSVYEEVMREARKRKLERLKRWAYHA